MSEDFKIECPKCKSIECQIDSVINVHAKPVINTCYQISTGTAFRLTCISCGHSMQINNCNEFMRKWEHEVGDE